MSDEYRLRQRRISFLLGFVLVVIVGLIVAGTIEWFDRRDDVRQARQDFCREVEAIRAYARAAASRSIESLPTIDYYRSHPAELDAALDRLRDQQARFSPPLDCAAFADNQPPIDR